jgi:hypothetical protein
MVISYNYNHSERKLTSSWDCLIYLFIHNLFNDNASNSRLYCIDDWTLLKNELKGLWKEDWPNLRYYAGTYMETQENPIRQDSPCPGWESNSALYNYKREALLLELTCSVIVTVLYWLLLQSERDWSSWCVGAQDQYRHVNNRQPLWFSGQSSWLHIQRSGFDSWRYQSSESGKGSTQPREYNWKATWKKQ